MKKYLVVYYSKSGNNAFLAKKAASTLQADLLQVIPNVKGIFGLLLFSWLNIPVKLNITADDLSKYDEIILFGPIWIGSFILPMKRLVNVCVEANKPFRYFTCCGVGDDKKTEKFGYQQVLDKVKMKGGDLVLQTEAFPTDFIALTFSENDGKRQEQVLVTEENFEGVFRERFERVMEEIMEEEDLLV